MLYVQQDVKAWVVRADNTSPIRIGWGKDKQAVAVVLTQEEARGLVKQLQAALQMCQPEQPKLDVNELNRKIGKNIRRERKVVGMTGIALAKSIGVTPEFISYLENGKRGASSETLARIANAVGCRIEDLLPGCQS